MRRERGGGGGEGRWGRQVGMGMQVSKQHSNSLTSLVG